MIVCELQCRGAEHVPFNAAMIATLRHAQAGTSIQFFAEAEQCERVVASLEQEDRVALELHEVDVGRRDATPMQRFARDFRNMTRVVREARDCGNCPIVVLSLNTPLLIAAKLLLWRHPAGPHVFAIPHSILESIKDRPARRPWYWLVNFRNALRLKAPTSLTYIMLGAGILDAAKREIPSLSASCAVLDHPVRQASFPVRHQPAPVFGFLGEATEPKGFSLFCRLAREISSRHPEVGGSVRFQCIGRVKPGCYPEEDTRCLDIKGRGRIVPRPEYDALCSAIRFAVFPYRAEAYRFYPSGAVFDAMLHGKPIVCLRTQYFEYLFRELGDIGYICDDYPALLATVERLLHCNHGEYDAKSNRVRSSIDRFRPSSLSPKLAAILRAAKERGAGSNEIRP